MEREKSGIAAGTLPRRIGAERHRYAAALHIRDAGRFSHRRAPRHVSKRAPDDRETRGVYRLNLFIANKVHVDESCVRSDYAEVGKVQEPRLAPVLLHCYR